MSRERDAVAFDNAIEWMLVALIRADRACHLINVMNGGSEPFRFHIAKAVAHYRMSSFVTKSWL